MLVGFYFICMLDLNDIRVCGIGIVWVGFGYGFMVICLMINC